VWRAMQCGRDLLVDVSANVLLAVLLVLSRHELMSVPREIDVEGRDKEVTRR
jgi:hypothetical protein